MGKSRFNVILLILLFCVLQTVQSGDVAPPDGLMKRVFTSIRLKFQLFKKIYFPPSPARSEDGQEKVSFVFFSDGDFVDIFSEDKYFLMGSPKDDEDLLYNEGGADGMPVRVKFTYSFAMMKRELSQKHWFSLTGENPSLFKEKKYCEEDHRVEPTDRGDVEMCPNHPVESVSWYKVQEFIKDLNEKAGQTGCDKKPEEAVGCYRLPTDAEWEFAARGETLTAYSFGDNPDDLDDYAWYWENSNGQTHRVGLKFANPYGLFDMHGNVWEWVLDNYGDYLPGGDNPLHTDSDSVRIVRGGSWGHEAWYLRSAHRRHDMAGRQEENVGFRLVMTL